MPVNINTKELEQVLAMTPAEQNIMLVGRHGIGKSQILTNFYAQQGMRVVSLFLGQMSDPGDIIGLPHKDEVRGTTEFLPPYWFPVDGQPIVLFLDELNRARPEILQTVMDLTLNRTLAGRQLPAGSRIISAVNDGEEYQLTELDPAMVSRFNIYNFRPSVEEWLLWASLHDIDSRVIAYIQENPKNLDESSDTKLDQGLEKSPDRRAWVRVSDILHDVKSPTMIHKKMVAGIVGLQVSASFFNSFSENRLVDARDLMLNYAKHKATIMKYQLHELATLNEAICRFFESTDTSHLNVETIAQNLTRYLHDIRGNGSKETMAHFVSLYESGNYPKTILFILQNAQGAYKDIQQFIKGL